MHGRYFLKLVHNDLQIGVVASQMFNWNTKFKIMQKVELENISNNANVLLCAVMDRNEITNKLNQVNGCPFNYILVLGNEIVYIGYSSSLCMRLHQHKYYKDFDRIIVIEMTDKKAARLMERTLIKQYKPKYNYQYLR